MKRVCATRTSIVFAGQAWRFSNTMESRSHQTSFGIQNWSKKKIESPPSRLRLVDFRREGPAPSVDDCHRNQLFILDHASIGHERELCGHSTGNNKTL